MDGGDLDYNTTSPIPGRRVTQQCIALCDTVKYSSLFSSDILKLAPCPPVWNKELLWEVAKRKGLSDSDTAAIASRCLVSRPEDEGEACDVTCILLICVGCMLMCMIGLQFNRQRRRQRPKLHSSRFGDTSRQAQRDIHHMNGSTDNGYDNQAYDSTADVKRCNSNVSNSDSTAKLHLHEEVPSGHYENLDNYDTIDSGHYDKPNDEINGVYDEVTKF